MKKLIICKYITLITCLVVGISSCVSPEKILYVQNVDTALTEEVQDNYELTIVKDDILRIVVLSENMESVAVFYPLTNQQGISIVPQASEYLVDSNGYINLPLIGPVEVSGLRIDDLEVLLQHKISKYVKDAIVDVRLTNFKVTVLGDVGRPGTFTVNDNRFTLLQALSRAGDIQLTAKRKNVLILRDVNGVQQSTRVDLTSSDFIYSPYYFLKQNDTVIVEPNNAKIQSAGIQRNVGVWLSITSLLLTTFVIINNNFIRN